MVARRALGLWWRFCVRDKDAVTAAYGCEVASNNFKWRKLSINCLKHKAYGLSGKLDHLSKKKRRCFRNSANDGKSSQISPSKSVECESKPLKILKLASCTIALRVKEIITLPNQMFLYLRQRWCQGCSSTKWNRT